MLYCDVSVRALHASRLKTLGVARRGSVQTVVIFRAFKGLAKLYIYIEIRFVIDRYFMEIAYRHLNQDFSELELEDRVTEQHSGPAKSRYEGDI